MGVSLRSPLDIHSFLSYLCFMFVYDPKLFVDLFNDQVTPTIKKDDRTRCWACDRELSATLDAYWGTDDFLARLCMPCRTKSERESKELENRVKRGSP